jgi:gluconate 5-dehydrogenase
MAAKVAERYGRPAILLALRGDGTAKGSGRSVEGIDILDAVRGAAGDLMLGGGGHAFAVGVTVREMPLDLTVEGSIRDCAAAAIAAAGAIDILLNNAGCNIRKPAVDVTWDDWNTILDTNLRGTFFMAQAIARHMIPRGTGRIINIGSVTSVFGYAGLTPYCASRGGVKQMTMSLADDLGPHGITVNCLAPGWFRTAQNDVMYRDEEWVAYLVDRIPLRRPGRAEDLDGAVVFLASDASGYVTGQTLLVDGGITTGSTRALPRPKT